MYVSQYRKLGAQAIKVLTNGPLRSTPRSSYLQAVEKGHLVPRQQKLFSAAAMDKSQEEVDGEIQKISVTFVNKDGEEKLIKVPIGMSMLEAAHENDIELGGACEGSLACSTCHVIVMDVEQYNKLEEPTDEEDDMLDLALVLTEM